MPTNTPTRSLAHEPRFDPSRRRILLSAAAITTTNFLTGCATTSSSPISPAPPCLAPVAIDERRIIRTAVGLRPYRASGFVVRAQVLAGKRLVHNYGHGGAGITLSWGTSRLAVDLGLQGHQGSVAVLGAGVVGLTTARLIQEAGFPVTLYAAALPPDTTSNVAGGQWNPFGHFDESAVTPEWRAQFRAAADYSWRRFQIMVGDDYGVRWLPTYTQTPDGNPEAPLTVTFPPVNRALSRSEHPFALDHVVRYDTMYVETGRFLQALMRDIQIAGGRFVVRRFAGPNDIASLSESLVFNCTGLGSRELFDDAELHPVRGQLAILLPQPEVRYAYSMRAGYMFPRPDGILLGGTFERNNWSLEADPTTTARILARHKALFADLRCA
jgi:glycine/D-amino acid oxidase-like deaminating enzyme